MLKGILGLELENVAQKTIMKSDSHRELAQKCSLSQNNLYDKNKSRVWLEQ